MEYIVNVCNKHVLFCCLNYYFVLMIPSHQVSPISDVHLYIMQPIHVNYPLPNSFNYTELCSL